MELDGARAQNLCTDPVGVWFAATVMAEVVGVVRHFEADAAVVGPRERAALGRFGEAVAADHLVASGLTVLARNWRCREGEVDIIALDGDVLVMCEVKTRRGVGFGTPIDAVTPAKAARLRSWR